MCALLVEHGFPLLPSRARGSCTQIENRPSGNDTPKIVPDKSLGSGLVFRMAVTVDLWTWLSHFAWHRYGLEEVHEAWP